MKVRKTKLGQLTFLAEGRFGRVFRADQFTLRGDPAPLAYKEFTSHEAAQARSAKAAVAFRGENSARRSALNWTITSHGPERLSTRPAAQSAGC